MAELRTAEQPHSATGDAERERVMAKIERGLADVEAGRVVLHADVLARIDARYPGSKK
ncbi:hypothetical protein ACNOYE_39510 [Nannocystaceae bacterium ST9]